MAKPFIPTDLASLKPVVEAMIFASEEPLGPRTLLRLLFEEEKKGNGKEKNGEGTLFEGADSGEGENGVDDVAVSPARAEEAETGSGAAADVSAGEAGAEADDSDSPAVEEREAEEADTTAGEPEEVAGQSIEEEEERKEGKEEQEEKGAEEGTDGRASSDEPENDVSSSSGKNGGDANESAPLPIGQKELRTIIDELNEEYEVTGRPFRIIEIAGGFQFATTREYGEFVGLLARDKMRRKLSPAALETLAIVAYRQPVTKPEVEAIRGVNCDQVLLSLLERNLLAITGRAETVGKPLLYGTTEEFLRAFGLNSLNDLPKLRELEELMEEDAHSPTKPEIIPEQIADRLLELNLPEGEEAEDKGSEGEGEPQDKENEGQEEVKEEETGNGEGEAKEEETGNVGEEDKESEGQEEAKEEETGSGEIEEAESGEEESEDKGNEGEEEETENGSEGEGEAEKGDGESRAGSEMNQPPVDDVESDEEGGGEAVGHLSS